MTLDKLIVILQRRIDRINKVGERTGETYSENEIYILKYLEELKTLRVELEKNSKELEIYKKALEMACEELETHPYSQWNTNEWFKYFSQKAREE